MERKVYIAGRDDIPRSVTLGVGEELDVVFVVLPGADCSVLMDVDLRGAGASAHISGLYLANASQKAKATNPAK